MLKITKKGITIDISSLEILQDAFYNSYLYEKSRGHLYDADKFYKLYECIKEGANKNESKTKS